MASSALSFVKDGVELSFFGDHGPGRVDEPLITHDHNIYVAPLPDIFGFRLERLYERRDLETYLYIVALIKQGISLKEVLAAARALFGNIFITEHCLMKLVFLQRPELEKLPADERALLAPEVDRITLPVPGSILISKSLCPD